MTFPTVTDAEVALGIKKFPNHLLTEAQQKGFDKDGNPYNDLFNKLFFSGGSLNWKPSLSMDERNQGGRYLRSIMVSFSPKHEHKEAVCAYILSELVAI